MRLQILQEKNQDHGSDRQPEKRKRIYNLDYFDEFVEQLVVGALMFTCMLITTTFTTNLGLPFIENVDGIMTGLCMPFVCLLELVGLLYVYRSHDFISDMMISTEENTCSTRIGTQWQMLPIILILCLLFKIATFMNVDYEEYYVYIALVPVLCVVAAIPIRACHNAYVFLKPTPRRET